MHYLHTDSLSFYRGYIEFMSLVTLKTFSQEPTASIAWQALVKFQSLKAQNILLSPAYS